VGAHVSELRRTRAGEFKISDAITLSGCMKRRRQESLDQVLISPDAALSFSNPECSWKLMRCGELFRGSIFRSRKQIPRPGE